MAQNGTLGTRKSRGIAALISSPSIAEAADKSGIGLRTLHTWLADADFQRALSAAESAAIAEAVRATGADMAANFATMREIRDDSEIPASVRLRAAQVLDASLLKWREIASIEERLVALEERASER